MSNPQPGTTEWLEQVVEEIVDPDREIVDSHHHLVQGREWDDYMLPDLWKDTGSGHKVIQTVFVECQFQYADEGPEHLKPVGETRSVAAIAEQSKAGRVGQPVISGILAHAELTLGDKVTEVLDAHQEAGGDLFKGIRHAGARQEDPAISELFDGADFRRGVKLLGTRGLTYESWHYHYQIRAYTELARAVPDTPIILDHFGTPLVIGPYEAKREEIFKQWKIDIAELSQCENVVVKLGGLAMPVSGTEWHQRALPPTSDEFVEAQKQYYLHTIDCFGPDRCMFESNFPVDRLFLSYQVVWNGFKKMVAGFSEEEKNMMFSGTAARVYNL